MDLETFQWLRTPEGQRLLMEAASFDDSLKAGTALRRRHSADQVAAALTQVSLRRKAVEKFGSDAARMYFTPDGLEQATRASVATHRARRLQAAQVSTLVDLGCGIGGDLIAAARAGITVAGVDLDPVRVAIASANLDALGLPGAVAVSDATLVDHSPFDVAFADPARRSGRGRSFSPDAWTPSWDFISQLFDRDSCVKVAPGIPHSLIPSSVEGEWVSDHGEVKEAALWSGRLASTSRRATVIGHGGLATVTDEDASVTEVRSAGRFLYEPDGAVIRAGLVGAVAAGVRGGLLDSKIAYVTSDDLFKTPFASAYAVLEELPYREKALKAALRSRGVGRLTIKKRGVAVAPEELRKRLSLSGDNEATIVLTRAADKGACWLVQPL